MRRTALVALVLIAAFGGTAFYWIEGADRRNFSQHPGFKAYFAANPPQESAPSQEERKLLERYRPRFFLPAGHEGLISFYDDYIAAGDLYGADGRIISSKVGKELLNRHKDNPDLVFVHRPERSGPTVPIVFARIDRKRVDLGDGPKDFTFLTYHAVFRTSGLPGGLSWWQRLPLSWVGDLKDWHQLDHYTAASIVLDDSGELVAMMLQQHNYQRTYLIGETVTLPADDRIAVDVAIGSNELYPHEPGRSNRRAVSFLSPKAWRYMIGARDSLFLTADDVTDPQHEQDYQLVFLQPSDAFYTFKGFLGERRLLMGRDGPPGADYKTLPEFMPLDVQFLLSYWRFGNKGDISRMERALARNGDGFAGYLEFARGQAPVFAANLACIRRWKDACAVQ